MTIKEQMHKVIDGLPDDLKVATLFVAMSNGHQIATRGSVFGISNPDELSEIAAAMHGAAWRCSAGIAETIIQMHHDSGHAPPSTQEIFDDITARSEEPIKNAVDNQSVSISIFRATKKTD